MTRLPVHRWIGSQNLSRRDRIGILLALIVGIGGLVFVFILPDPLLRLAPQIPFLSSQDWQGSYVSTKLFMSEPSAPWKERRRFYRSLGLNPDEHTNALIDQTMIWFANPAKAAAAWDQLDTKFYNGQPIVARNTEQGKPASMLFCGLNESADFPGHCFYLAYWDHWYTEVRFWSQYEEDLQLPEIQQIISRVDQRLIAAPAEPCYGILCIDQ
jgi:hypothetical protein